MAIVDSKGRLFGKVNILDLGAVLVILAVILGVLLPSTTGVAQLGSTVKPVEFDVVVRNLSPSGPVAPLKAGDKPKLVIRNQPFGEVTVVSVQPMPRNVVVPQPDGSVKALPDPRPEAQYGQEYYVTLAGDARLTEDGPILGNNKLKQGVQVELEGFNYNYPNLYVHNVRVKE